MPGEAKGIVIDKAEIKPINIATMSMGQSIAVSPIQLLMAVSAVANDGLLLKPQIIREVRDKTDKIIRPFQAEVVRQAMDKNAAGVLKEILEDVVAEGTGKGAAILGYRIAGKTGTAQKVGASGYEAGK